MNKEVEFYYDYVSPTSYLGWVRLLGVAERTGASILYRPVFLAGVMKGAGNTPPGMVKTKGKWMLADMTRHAAYHDIPFAMNPHFIFNTISIMRGAVWAQQAGVFESYNRAVFEACWINQKNMGDGAVIDEVMSAAGLNSAEMAAAIQTDEIKSALMQSTNEAVERGVFGVPAMFVGDEMHWGQDRIDWVERALA